MEAPRLSAKNPIRILPTITTSDSLLQHMVREHEDVFINRPVDELPSWVTPEYLQRRHEDDHDRKLTKSRVFTPYNGSMMRLWQTLRGVRHSHVRQEGLDSSNFDFQRYDKFIEGKRRAKQLGLKPINQFDDVLRHNLDEDQAIEAWQASGRLSQYVKARIHGVTHDQWMDAMQRGINDKWYANQRAFVGSNKNSHRLTVDKAESLGLTNGYTGPLSDEANGPKICSSCDSPATNYIINVHVKHRPGPSPSKRNYCSKHVDPVRDSNYYKVFEGVA